MKILVGLGNPGEKYTETRHNAGFIILDELRKKLEFPEFEFSKKFNALISEKNIVKKNKLSGIFRKIFNSKNEEKLILIKPQTFMNLSGQTLRSILDFYKLSSADLIVLNDDLDITIGKYKLTNDSSARGHNGVQSIINSLGTQNFKRLKIGIEKKSGRSSRQTPGEKFVLEKFSPDELKTLLSLADKIIEEIQ